MRTVLTRLLVALVLVSGPLSASAATMDLDRWRVTATEDSAQLNLAVQYTGADQAIVTQVTAPTTDTITSVITPVVAQPNDILINEFVSDPVTGQPEWVELYNQTESPIDLADWYLLEGSGKLTLLSGVIPSEGWLVVLAPKGALNNDGDLIQLYDPSDNWIDGVAYGTWESASAPAVADPFSAGRNASNQFVQMSPTQGAVNQVVAASSDAAVSTAAQENNATTTSQPEPTPTYDVSAEPYPPSSTTTTCTTPLTASGTAEDGTATGTFVDLAAIRTYPVGTELTTEGLVAVAPGILGKQFFYLSGSGVQVYLYSAEFPTLARGMRVRVSGMLSDVQGELRLKASKPEDIQILGQENPPMPHDITTAQIGEDTEGWLVRITGSVSDVSSDALLFSDTEGDVRVVAKSTTGITNAGDVGDNLTITGIVSQTTSGYRLLPRDQQDIVFRTETQAAAGGTVGSSGGGAAGWALLTLALTALAASAGVYGVRKYQVAKPLTA